MNPTYRSLVILIALVPWLGGCGLLELKDRAVGALIERIPVSFEVSLGEQLLPSILPPDKVLQNPQADQLLATLLKPLLTALPPSNLPIRILISKEPALNAFALPGGILVFNRGFLLAAQSPEEVLGVAAHELAHARERHVLRSMIQSLSLYAVITLFLGDVQGLGAILIQQGNLLLQSGFSRAQEKQADAKGFEYLVAAGSDPRGLMRFFRRLEEENPQGQNPEARALSFFSTHPLTSDRIKAIQESWDQLGEEEKKRIKPQRFNLKLLQDELT